MFSSLHFKYQKLTSQFSQTNFLSRFLGFTIIILFSILITLLTSSQLLEKWNYYIIIFETKSVTGIRKNTKIRYQGSLIIGKVAYIKSNFVDKHYVTAYINKEFRIPRRFTKASIQTWGYFGNRFINIFSISQPKNQLEMYQDKDIMVLESPKNLSTMLNDIKKVISKDNKVKLSLLETKLFEVRKNLYNLTSNSIIRNLRKGSLKKVNLTLRIKLSEINEFLNSIDSIIEFLDEETLESITYLQEEILWLNKQTDLLKKTLNYGESKLNSFSRDYLLENKGYSEIMVYLKHVNNLLEKWGNNPNEVVVSFF